MKPPLAALLLILSPTHGFSQADAQPLAAPSRTASFDLEARKSWWSLQPVANTTPPSVEDTTWPRTPHDHFVLAALEQKSWQPAPPASRASWLRRLTYDLTGLPPTTDEVETFLADTNPDAFENAVDRLLASPHFGEQWARHWMDLVRYAETKAFEADYPMPNAYHYRDYLVRAFNRDVPYDQLLREAIAGDLLEPRLDPTTGNNESVIGPGYLYLTDGQHGPPDIHADEARIFDDMIDVVGKAFLGQTVACARCHDHKFDAISTRDYYSLYGVIASSRIDYADITSPAERGEHQATLLQQKTPVRHALAAVLAADLQTARADLQAVLAGTPSTPQQLRWAAALESKPNPALQALASILQLPGTPEIPQPHPTPPQPIGDLSPQSFGTWIASGIAFGTAPARPGDFVIPHDGDTALKTFASTRPTAGHLSSRFAGSLKSPDFTIAGDSVSVRVKGENARVNLYVRHYELVGRGPTTSGTTKIINGGDWQEIRFDTRLWTGEPAYIEIQHNGGQINFDWATAGHTNGAFVVLDTATNNTPLPPLHRNPDLWSTAGSVPATTAAALDHVAAQLGTLAAAWHDDTLTAGQADLLAALHGAGVLDFSVDRSVPLSGAVAAYRDTLTTIPSPTYVRTLSDGHGSDVPVYIRGSHKDPSTAPNPRHFLDAIDPAPFAATGSGRRQWAEALASPDNPLAARVVTNRVWHHLFGRGIVASVDDLGHMGDTPSHPELLDFLASRFIKNGWSIKSLVRDLTLSSTYRMSSNASAEALRDDPDNTLLQHMPVRRLQAEAVRDTILAVSGQLDTTLFGPGQPGESGGRRSLYVQLRRRYMPEFLMTFDMPNASETFGRRNTTASPAQSLAMMNGDLVWKAAEAWARQTVSTPAPSFAARVDRLHRQAFARPASEREHDWARSFLADHHLDETAAANHNALFVDLCHAMLNRKELIYVY